MKHARYSAVGYFNNVIAFRRVNSRVHHLKIRLPYLLIASHKLIYQLKAIVSSLTSHHNTSVCNQTFQGSIIYKLRYLEIATSPGISVGVKPAYSNSEGFPPCCIPNMSHSDDLCCADRSRSRSPTDSAASTIYTSITCSYPDVAMETTRGCFSTRNSSLSPTSSFSSSTSMAVPFSPSDSITSTPSFSPNANSSSFESIIYDNQDTKQGQNVSAIETHPSPLDNTYMDINGNISDKYSAGPHECLELLEERTHQDERGTHEYYSFPTSYYSEDINGGYLESSPSVHTSSPNAISDGYYTGYTTQSSYDSEDSFEVPCTEYTDTELGNHISGTQQIAIIHNTTYPDSCPLPNFAVFTETKKVPNRRGRPVTYRKPGHHYSDTDSLHSDADERVTTQPRGCRRGAKNILLWKFLLGELRKPNSSHVRWEDERQGLFKFVDTAECSRLWGEMKKKNDMNFEKLSRGIRHYYKDGLMSRRDGIRLVYKFNWDRVPKAFWPRNGYIKLC